MNIVRGDLIELALAGRFDVIVHGCNCYCAMGKGIALSIKRVFPEAYAADCATVSGDAGKLGTFTVAHVRRGGVELSVANAYTQLHWRGAGTKVDYDAVRRAMEAVKRAFSGKRIGYPKIGAGLAGGDWDRIATLIDAALAGEGHTCVEYVPAEAR